MHEIKNILIILILCSISTLPLIAQSEKEITKPIRIKYENISISNLLDSLNKKYQVDFSYDPNTIPTDSIISINEEGISIIELLGKTLSNTKIDTLGNQIIITNNFAKRKSVLSSKNLIVNGTVFSANTNKPISYANISILGKALGTISNAEGEFSLIIPDSLAHSTIVVSSLSYNQKRYLVPNSDTSIFVALREKFVQIKEIKIKNIKADEVIENCISAFNDNYINEPQTLKAFFRETIIQDGQYIDVAEAVLQIDKSEYSNSIDEERVKFIKGRKVKSETDVSVARLKLAGGPAVFAKLDVVKHRSFFNTNDKDTKYVYKHNGYIIEHDRLMYKISFKPIITEDNLYYEGEFIIDTESYALSSVKFAMTKRSLKNSADYLIKQHAKKIKSTPYFTEYRVNYRPINDKWILNNVRGELKIRMSDKRNKQSSEYHAVAELLISDATYNSEPLRNSESFKTHYILADEIKETDIAFWKDYNVITPDEDLENVFKKPISIYLVPNLKKPDKQPGF
ncbi:carboxypeptidase-like regulatory domain-containing protein [Saccharicrinis aurantiacus]|uniref:carboxypeptidase-like regulatory domain-containing protein n=1 Tax=Saccharicrinis aurantiacus TaxID=1849719 RepID=UPI002490E7B2|nr:carboxypeptidase-like regulatory domain-containing protein [Saccharicrinis aurantiacus]